MCQDNFDETGTWIFKNNDHLNKIWNKEFNELHLQLWNTYILLYDNSVLRSKDDTFAACSHDFFLLNPL